MAWSAVGTVGTINTNTATAASFTWAPGAVGNVMYLEVRLPSTSNTITSVSSTNATWTQVAVFAGTTNANHIYLYQGVASSTSSATVSLVLAGSPGTNTIRSGRQEFHSSVGASPLVVATSHLDSSGTNTWPTVSGSGLYVGWAYNSGTAVNGSTTGFTYQQDSNGNSFAYDLSATSTSAPVFGDSTQAIGVMAMVVEAVNVTKGTADEVAATSGVASSTTSISPPAGSMVRWAVAWLNSNDTLGLTFTAADSHGTSFGAPTIVPISGPGDGDGGCYLMAWDHVYSSAPGATTLTVTAAGSGVSSAAPSNCLILPYTITGQASSPRGALNSYNEVGTSTTTYEISLTTTAVGSAVFVFGAPNHNGGATGAVTPISGTITDVDWDDATVGSRGTLGRGSALTTTPGATTFGWTSANPSPNGYGVMAAEVLPASAPSGTNVSLLAASVSQPGLGGVVPSTATASTTTYSLYSQGTPSPGPTETQTGVPGTLGMEFTVSSAATLTGVWFYSPSGYSLTGLPASIGIYTVTGTTLVASNTSPSWKTTVGGSTAATAGGGWAYAAFSSPVSLSASTNYMLAVQADLSTAWFVDNETAGSTAKSNGILAQVNNGQGWYTNGTPTVLTYPGSQLSGWSWFLDANVTQTTKVKLQVLIDPFPGSSLNATNWYVEPDAGSGNPSGTVTVTGGLLKLSGGTYSDAGYYTSVNSQIAWDLTNSYAFVKVTPGESGTSDGDSGMSILASNFSDGYNFDITGGNLQVQSTVSDSPTTLHTVTYNSTSHAWLRIRESNGTIYFETAPDGLTWTTQYSTTTETVGSWSAATSYVQFFYGSAAGSSSPTGTANFANFNVAAASPTSVSLLAASSTSTAYSPALRVSPPLSLASLTATANPMAIPNATGLLAASLNSTAYTLGTTSNHALPAASESVTSYTLTPIVSQSLLLASSTETAYTLVTHPQVALPVASQTVTALSPGIPRTVSLLAASVEQTTYSPVVLIAAGANLLTATIAVTAYPVAPTFSGGASLLAAGQVVTPHAPTIPRTLTLPSASLTTTAYTLTSSELNILPVASQTVTAYSPTIGRTLTLLTGSVTTTARNLTTIARVALPTASSTVTAFSPSVVTPPATTVNLLTAVAASISAQPIGFVPPVFVNLLPAFVNRGAVRIGPPNLPVMTMTYASGYDNFGNYIPKGFNLYGTQADQLTMSQDLYYIPQPVHGVTTNVFLPTVSFQMSQEYTTKSYNPSIMFATPNNIGFSYENTYTSINSGSIDASGGSAQSVAGVNLSSEPYDGSTSAYVSFQAGNGENVAVNQDGFHVTSGTRVALTAYQQSTHTTVQPGMLAEINNQGTSNEYTSAYFSAGSTSSHAETYIYMGSASASGSASTVIQFVMGGSVEAQITSGNMTVYGTISANNFSGSYAGGQTVTGFPIASGAGIGTANLTTGNVTIAGGFMNALNSIYNALVNSGLA